MNTFKKILSLLLAAILMCSCMVLTIFAEDTTATWAANELTIVPITDCESTDGFSRDSTGVLDSNAPWAGKASLATTVNGVGTIAKVKYQFQTKSVFDASAMKTLVFDVYLSNAELFESTRWEIELRSVGGDDQNELAAVKTLTDISGTVLQDGWNHIEIAIADLTQAGNYDASRWNYFRIYNYDACGYDGDSCVFKLDNVYMTSRDKVVPEAPVSNKIKISGTISQQLTGTTQVSFEKMLSPTRDITYMDRLQFDIRIGHTDINDIKFCFEFSSAGRADINELGTGQSMVLKDLIGEEIPADGQFHTVSIPLYKFSNTHKSDATEEQKYMDLTKVNYFRVYSVKVGDSMTEAVALDIRSICLVKDETEGEVPIWDGQSTSQAVGGTTQDIWLYDGCTVAGYGPSISDVDGDGKKEWVLLDVDGSGTIHKQGGYSKENGWLPALKGGIQLGNHVHVGYGNMIGLKFDLYVENEVWLDKQLCIELTSSGKADHAEINATKTLKQWFGNGLKIGWNSVELPLSAFTKSTQGKNTVFRPTNFNCIRISSESTFDFTGGTAIAIANLKVVRGTNDETTDEIPLGETEKLTMSGAKASVVIPTDKDFANEALQFLVADETNDYAYNTNVTLSFTPLDMSNKDMLCADLYLEGYENMASFGSFVFELSSSGKADHNEFNAAYYSLSDIFRRVDGQPLQNGWNKVYSKLTLKEDGGVWLDCAGGNGANGWGNPAPIDKTAVNYMRIYTSSAFNSYGSKCVAAIDNLHFVGTNMKDAPNHPDVIIQSATLNIQDAFNVIYTTKVHETMTAASMLVEISDANGQVTRTQINGEKGENVNELIYTYEGITPEHMSDNIRTTLWALNYEGKLVMDKVSEYSIKQYCSNMLNGIAKGTVKDEDGTFATLLCDALVFGAALQKYTGYNTDHLVTDGIDLSAATPGYTGTPSYAGLRGEQGKCPATFISASAIIQNIYKLRITFEADDVTNLKMKLTPNIGNSEIIIDTFETMTVEDGEGNPHDVYYVEIPVRAYDLDLAYIVTFEGYKDYRLVYSLSTYLASQRADTISDLEMTTDPEKITKLSNYKDLLESIVFYGTSAKNYARSQR